MNMNEYAHKVYGAANKFAMMDENKSDVEAEKYYNVAMSLSEDLMTGSITALHAYNLPRRKVTLDEVVSCVSNATKSSKSEIYESLDFKKLNSDQVCATAYGKLDLSVKYGLSSEEDAFLGCREDFILNDGVKFNE